MKVDLNKPILDLLGDPVKISVIKGKSEEVWTIKRAVCDALMQQYQAEITTGDQKLARYSLALKIHESNGEIDLKAEQIVLMKEVANLAYAPLVYGRICEMLDK